MCEGCAQGSFATKDAIMHWKVVAEKAVRMYDVFVVFDSPQSDMND